jgi:hypothetical protein
MKALVGPPSRWVVRDALICGTAGAEADAWGWAIG